MKVAAIITCHNRKDKTIACVDSLLYAYKDADVYLTDDGCTDGTVDEIIRRFPETHIINGSGDLYWSRGMYMAWKEALKSSYDYYLWLNDDIVLYDFFWIELQDCLTICGEPCIISGLVCDKETGEVIYGGTDKNGVLLQESNHCQPIANMNGNVVLVPNSVVKRIGIIDPVYVHDIGDVDYGLTAQENGIGVFVTRRAVAAGCSNGKMCRVRKYGVSLVSRFRHLYAPLGANPKIHFYFYKKHKGIILAIAVYLYLHLINILSDSIVKFIWHDKFLE